MSESTVTDSVKSVVTRSVSEWAALDSQYERLIDPADPLLAEGAHRKHDRRRVIRWQPGRACA